MEEMISRMGSSSSTTKIRSVVMGKVTVFAGGLNLTQSSQKYNARMHKKAPSRGFMIYKRPKKSPTIKKPYEPGHNCVFGRSLNPAGSLGRSDTFVLEFQGKVPRTVDRWLDGVRSGQALHYVQPDSSFAPALDGLSLCFFCGGGWTVYRRCFSLRLPEKVSVAGRWFPLFRTGAGGRAGALVAPCHTGSQRL